MSKLWYKIAVNLTGLLPLWKCD